MQVTPAQKTSAEAPRTTASAARRAQIVAATIEVIADLGLGQASFNRIADRAGLSSTRLISYHFAGREELIGAVTESVLHDIGAHVAEHIDAAQRTAEEQGIPVATPILRAYIEGTIAFIAGHRAQMQSLMQIVLSGAAGAGTVPDVQRTSAPLEGLLRHGQSSGEFRDFDVVPVAAAVQRAVEGFAFQLAAQPGLDAVQHGAELAELYVRGVQARGAREE